MPLYVHTCSRNSGIDAHDARAMLACSLVMLQLVCWCGAAPKPQAAPMPPKAVAPPPPGVHIRTASTPKKESAEAAPDSPEAAPVGLAFSARLSSIVPDADAATAAMAAMPLLSIPVAEWEPSEDDIVWFKYKYLPYW